MKTQGSALLLLALLLSLPGCGGSDNGDGKQADKKYKKVKRRDQGQRRYMAEDDRTDRNDLDLLAEADESLASFFDMDDLVALNDDDLSDLTLEDSLEAVYFDFAKDAINEDQYEKVALDVDRAKELLEQDESAQLLIEGHACHSAGTPEYNRKISERRARKVAERLVQAGIPEDRLRVVGRGVDMPIVADGGRDEQWCNRRVELHTVHA